MKTIKELLDNAHLTLAICKAETANIKHIDLLGKAMEIIRQIIQEENDKKNIFKK